MDEDPLAPNWQNEQQGGAANLGFFGGNPHQNQNLHVQHNLVPQQLAQQDQNPEPMEEDEADVDWPAWNLAIFVMDNGQEVP